jgi:hypothetical protein
MQSGEAIDPDGSYEIEVPIYKGTIVNGEAVNKPIDHKYKMRLAWLKSGQQGLFNYLRDYLTSSQMDQMKLFFMKRAA